MNFNPYDGASFFSFFAVFLNRLWNLFIGQLPLSQLASDEIQVFVLIGIAASSALVGTFLILKRMTMLANALSHTILLGIVLAFIMSSQKSTLNLPAMLFAAVLTGLLTTFLTELLTKAAGLQEDASTGLVFTSLFALGIILVTLLTKDAHIGTEVVMGNVDALHISDLALVYVILAANVILFILFFKEYAITTFDPPLAIALGFSALFFNYLLMTQVSITVIGAFRAVGVLMVLAFITGPVLTARLLTHSLKKLILLAICIGSCESLIGVALSRHLLSEYGMALSTSGLVVCVIIAAFILTSAFVKFHAKGPNTIQNTF